MIILEIKKILLVHENHDKWPNITPVQHFCSGFDHASLVHVSSLRGSKYLPNIKFSNMYVFAYEHLYVLFEKIIIFSPVNGRLGTGHIFRTGGDRCLLQWQTDKSVNTFLSSF